MYVPHVMLVRGGHGGVGDGGAVVELHEPLCQDEVPEERRDQQVLAEQPLEQLLWEDVPGDGVRDGREDPVQLAQHRPPVGHLARHPATEEGRRHQVADSQRHS